jgi:hypothetical protein
MRLFASLEHNISDSCRIKKRKKKKKNTILSEDTIFVSNILSSLSFQDPVNAGYHSVQNNFIRGAQQAEVRSVCTISHVSVADMILAKRADIYVEIRIKEHKCNLTMVCLKKLKISPTCI